MKTLLRHCLAVCLALVPGLAAAAYNCSVTAPGFIVAYDPTAASPNITTTYFTITCTRALSDASTMAWSNAANNGVHSAGGGRNRAQFGTSRISYDTYRDSACGSQWRGGTTIAGTLNFGGSTSASMNANFWGCVPAGQTGLPAGTYTDTVTMTLTYGPSNFTDTGTFGVAITTPAVCNLTTAPGNVVFNYTGFGATVNASSSFGVTCTNALPYTMALDATSGTLAGVNYTLALSASSGTGTGVQQTYGINGASQARTLTVSY
jgi:spore coat protein U-like protein